MIGDTWTPTASMRNLYYVFENSAKHKSRVHQLYLIGTFLQANVKHIVSVAKWVGLQTIYRVCEK